MFVDKVFQLVGEEFEIRSEYKKNDEKILMFHRECGREFFIKPADFKKRKRCSLCNGKFKKSTEEFKNEVFKLSKTEYEVLGNLMLG